MDHQREEDKGNVYANQLLKWFVTDLPKKVDNFWLSDFKLRYLKHIKL